MSGGDAKTDPGFQQSAGVSNMQIYFSGVSNLCPTRLALRVTCRYIGPDYSKRVSIDVDLCSPRVSNVGPTRLA